MDVDPAYGRTHPVGVPRQNVPGRNVQKNNQIWLLNNVENGLRIIPLDDRKRDPLDAEYPTDHHDAETALWALLYRATM